MYGFVFRLAQGSCGSDPGSLDPAFSGLEVVMYSFVNTDFAEQALGSAPPMSHVSDAKLEVRSMNFLANLVAQGSLALSGYLSIVGLSSYGALSFFSS